MVTSGKKGTKRAAKASDDDDEVRQTAQHTRTHTTLLTILVLSHQDHAGVDRMDRPFKRARIVPSKATTDVQARLLKKQHRAPTVVRYFLCSRA